MRLNAVIDPARDPGTDCLRLLFRVIEGLDFGGRAIEHRHGTASIFRVGIYIG